MTEIGLFSADQVGLLECRWWGTITNLTARKSLVSLGLVEPHPAREDLCELSIDGLEMCRKVLARLPEGSRPLRVRDVEPGDHIQCWPHDTPSVITGVEPVEYAGTIRLNAEPVGWVLAPELVVLLIPESGDREPEPLTQMSLFD